MIESTPKKPARRGRVFPETVSAKELARLKAEDDAFWQRCQVIFDRVRPHLIVEHYGWFIAIDDSSDYFIDANKMVGRHKYPNADHYVFCLNEIRNTGII